MTQTTNLSDLASTAKDGYLVSVKTGTAIKLDGIMIMGRDPVNEICVDDPYVSLRHCQLEKRPLGFFIRDLKSRNGVHLNGLRILEGQLTNGTEVRVGSQDILIQSQ